MEELRPSQLITIVKELQKQVEIEGVMEQYNKWSFMASIIVNGFNRVVRSKKKPKTVKPEDFLSKRAKQLIKGFDKQAKTPDWSKHIKDSQDKGLKGPWEGGGQ